MSKIVDLTDKRFGKLVALRKGAKKEGRSTSYWECACDCGNVVPIRVDHLTGGRVQSCGCVRKEQASKMNASHGMSKTSEYKIWKLIKDRCYNPKTPNYERYGGKGITVSDEWRESFEAFYRDMGPRPSLLHSVDRMDGTKGYYKGNCRWATDIEQANNMSTNIHYTFDGERKTLADWCREFDINYKAMHALLTRGVEFEDAVNHLLKKKKQT